MNLWLGIDEFVAVAETSSFTTAGKRLGISTAQVSRQINILEQRLGTKLFYRTTRKVTLTEEGQLYYHHCARLLDGLKEAEQVMNNLKTIPQGIIKLTAPVTYGEQFIAPLLNNFMLLHSAIEIDFELTNRQVDLVTEGFDLAIRLGQLKDSSLIAKKLSSRSLHVCASPEYLSQYGTPETPQDLNRHSCLIGNNPYWRFHFDNDSKIMPVSGRLRCNGGFSLLDATIKGLGLSQLPSYYLESALASGQVVEVLEAFREADDGIWAIYPNKHLIPAKVRALIMHLSEHLNG